MKTIEGTSCQQMQFTSLDDLVGRDNPVLTLDACVEKLDLLKIGVEQSAGKKQTKTNPGGAPRFDDRLLLQLYLYGHLNRIRSSRKLEQECHRNIELRLIHQLAVMNSQRKQD